MHKVWEYDAANRPISEKEWVDNQYLITQKKYDRASRLVSESDPSGNKTSYEYDALGNVIAIHYPDGGIERKEYNALGNTTKEIDQNGYETKKNH